MDNQIKPYASNNLTNPIKTSQAALIKLITSDVVNIKSNNANSKLYNKKDYIIIALMSLFLFMLMNNSNNSNRIVLSRLSYL